MTISDTSMTRPTWLTSDCPSWCHWAPHSERELPADRNHCSGDIRTPLTLEEPVLLGGDTYTAERAAVYLMQHDREREPRVGLSKGEMSEGLWLTLDEAEKLAAGQMETVVRARG